MFSPRIDARGNSVNAIEIVRVQRQQFREFRRQFIDEEERDPLLRTQTGAA